MLKKNYSAAVFDLDGTLLDTLSDLAEAMNHVLSCAGRAPCTREQVRSYVGNGVKKLVERAFSHELREDELDESTALFKAYYRAHINDNTVPYDGITEMLKTLKGRGVRVAVVSNKFDAGVKTLVESHFPGLVDTAIGERDNIPKKPDPKMVSAALRELGAFAKDALYIGDSETDAATAKNAGLDFLGVAWGFRDAALLRANGATAVCDRPAEISDFFSEA